MLSKRHLNIVKNRVANLPKRPNIFPYLINTAKFYRAKRKKLTHLPHPHSVMLEITNHCQLKCITCAREYSWGREMAQGHMDIEKAKGLIDNAHLFLDRITLTGLGEPLLYPHLSELIDYIHCLNEGISIFLSTNAQSTKTPEIIQAVSDKVDTLQISIDGIGEVFEKIRRKSRYDAFLENLQAITRVTTNRRAEAKLNMVVFKDNYSQMLEVIKLAKESGIREVNFNTINLVATELDTSHYDIYQSEDFLRELKKVERLSKQENIHAFFQKMDGMKGFEHCPYPWDAFFITWDGFLVPCCAKPFPKEKHFGNVFQTGLMSCLNSAAFIEFRKMAIANEAPSFCERCHYLQ
jgi:radical SAM protein with 4Fe4S-binding SPASM domain